MPEQTTPPVHVGIDVCKGRLDIHIHPTGLRLAVVNDVGGWRRLKRVLGARPVARIVMEATSRYHRAARRSLHAAGLAVAIVDPLRARLFAKAIGTLAKTDAVDARMLALMAERLDPAVTPPARTAVMAVQELDRARSAAIAERVALGNRHAVADHAFLRTELARRLRSLETHIARLDSALARTIAADPVLAARHAILCSIPGIGTVTATALIANLDEIGALSSKQVAALAGLAPAAHDSGTTCGRRHIRGGRAPLRQALYMAALSAARYNPALNDLRTRLREKGKPAKLALIAVARKLLVLANTLVAQNRPWVPTPA
ncbi:MAG: transposase [Sphingomonas fennica]